MRFNTTLSALASALTFGITTVDAQAPSLGATPATLIAGGGAQTISISSSPLASIPFTATWNGVSTPVKVTSSAVPYGTVFSVTLTADDLAVSQLGQFNLYDGRTSSLIGSVTIPVVYPVTAAATLYDSSRGLLYLSTGAAATPSNSADPRFPADSLIAIDVKTGKVVHTLNLKAAGGAIAMSDDFTALYVAVAPNIIRHIDLGTITALGDFATPAQSSSGGTFTSGIDDIAVMPGSPTTLAVNYESATGPELGIFDNGVERANTMNARTDRMLFSPDAKYVFLAGEKILVDSSGIPAQTPGSAPSGAPVAIVNDTLYTANGISLNWSTMQVTGNLDHASAVAVDPVNNRLLACFSNGPYATSPVMLQAFDLATQTPLGIQPLALAPVNLYPFGTDGLIDQSADSILLFHTPLAGPAPSIASSSIVNAASFSSGPIAPGEVMTIFGSSLGPAAGASFNVAGASVVNPAGMEVWFDRLPGTVLFAQSGQMNVVAPFELSPASTVQFQVWNNGIPSSAVPLTVASTAPALFTRNGSGQGLVAMNNQDGTINTPAPKGSVVSLYGTGGGMYPDAHDGEIADTISWLSGSVRVTIGGQNAQVQYAGAAPGLVSSVFQLNVQIPQDVSPGSVPVVVTIGGQTSPQGVTIEVR